MSELVSLPVTEYLGSIADVEVFRIDLDDTLVGFDRPDNPKALYLIQGASPQWVENNHEALNALVQKVANER